MPRRCGGLPRGRNHPRHPPRIPHRSRVASCRATSCRGSTTPNSRPGRRNRRSQPAQCHRREGRSAHPVRLRGRHRPPPSPST
ncbi:MAG: hypothetical protein EBT79_11580 [Actinobacteria bacterium]|nr:hypothetical protein [Actinomycetota bacterium]